MENKKKGGFLLPVLIIIMALLWGFSFLGTKRALVELEPIEVLAVRWPIALIAFTILILSGKIKVNYKGKPIWLLVVTVLAQPVLYAFFEAWGIDLTTASESAIFIAAVPLMVVILGRIFFRQKVNKQTLTGIVIGLAGVCTCVCFAPDFKAGSKFFGYLILIIAVICGALYMLLTSKATKHFSVWEITYGMTFGGGIAFPIASLVSGHGIHPYQVLFAGGGTMLGLLYLGIGCSFIAYLINNYSISKLSPAVSSCFCTNGINVVAVTAGIVFGDSWGWYTVVGVILTVIGIGIAGIYGNKE